MKFAVIFWIVKLLCVFALNINNENEAIQLGSNGHKTKGFELIVKPLAFFGQKLEIHAQKTSENHAEVNVFTLSYSCKTNAQKDEINLTWSENAKVLLTNFTVPLEWNSLKCKQLEIKALDSNNNFLKGVVIDLANFVLSCDARFAIDGQTLGIWAHCTAKVVVNSVVMSLQSLFESSRIIMQKPQIVGASSVLLANALISLPKDVEAEFIHIKVAVEEEIFCLSLPIMRIKFPLGFVAAVAGQSVAIPAFSNMEISPTKAIVKNNSDSITATARVTTIPQSEDQYLFSFHLDSRFENSEYVYIFFYSRNALLNPLGFMLALAKFCISIEPSMLMPEGRFRISANCAVAIPILDSIVLASCNSQKVTEKIVFSSMVIVGTNTFITEAKLPKGLDSCVQIRAFSNNILLAASKFPIGKVFLRFLQSLEGRIAIYANCEHTVLIDSLCISNKKAKQTILQLNPAIELKSGENSLLLEYQVGMEFAQSKTLYFEAYCKRYPISEVAEFHLASNAVPFMETIQSHISFLPLVLLSSPGEGRCFAGMLIQIQAISNLPTFIDAISIKCEAGEVKILPINPAIEVSAREKVIIASFLAPKISQSLYLDALYNGKVLNQSSLHLKIYPAKENHLFLTVEPITFLPGTSVKVFGMISGAAAIVDSISVDSKIISLYPPVTIINGILPIISFTLTESKPFIEINAFWRGSKVNPIPIFIYPCPLHLFPVVVDDYIEIWAESIFNSIATISTLILSNQPETVKYNQAIVLHNLPLLMAKIPFTQEVFNVNVSHNGNSLLPHPQEISIIPPKAALEHEGQSLQEEKLLNQQAEFISLGSQRQYSSTDNDEFMQFLSEEHTFTTEQTISISQESHLPKLQSPPQSSPLDFNSPLTPLIILETDNPSLLTSGQPISIYATSNSLVQIDALTISSGPKISTSIPIKNIPISPHQKTLILSNWIIPTDYAFTTRLQIQAITQKLKLPVILHLSLTKQNYNNLLPIVATSSFQFRKGESIQIIMQPRAPSYAGVKFARLRLFAGLKIIYRLKDFSITFSKASTPIILGEFYFERDAEITLKYVAVIEGQRIDCSSFCHVSLEGE